MGAALVRQAIEKMKIILIENDVKALHLEVNKDNERAQAALWCNLGFEMRRQYHLMTAEF